ncbi:MAG: hypothetical protein LCH95_21995 [Proteobacteria bacterium]|nr:hypothetical protein [Pseudomonadota bacterium]
MNRPVDAPKKIESILFVGNSYLAFNNGIGWHVSRLLAEGRPAYRLRSTSVSITGGGLDWHDLASYFRPDAVGSYRYDEHNNVVIQSPTRLFDVVVMLDGSQGPVHPALKDRFAEAARRFSAITRRHGAEPVFLATWAYHDRPEMTAQLAEAYEAAGRESDAAVIPVGRAFERVRAERPDIALHMADKSHPTLAGTYLAACMVLAVLFPGQEQSGWTSELDAATADYLQSVAGKLVQRTGETRIEP